MYERARLFLHQNPYDWEHTEALFFCAVKRNVEFQRKHCFEYARILRREGFSEQNIKTMNSLADIPAIPSLYLKKHGLYSLPPQDYVIQATSSGTKGVWYAP